MWCRVVGSLCSRGNPSIIFHSVSHLTHTSCTTGVWPALFLPRILLTRYCIDGDCQVDVDQNWAAAVTTSTSCLQRDHDSSKCVSCLDISCNSRSLETTQFPLLRHNQKKQPPTPSAAARSFHKPETFLSNHLSRATDRLLCNV